MWDGPSGATRLSDAVDKVECFLMDGDHAFGVQFSQGDLQPGPGVGGIDDGVEFKVKEFTDS